MRNSKSKILTTTLLSALWAAPSLVALEAPKLPADCTAKATDSLNEAFGRCVQALTPKAKSAAVDEKKDEAQEAIAKTATTATAPDSFAGRVNDSLADFLPLFQGAVNATPGKDNQSLTLAFNMPLLGDSENQDRNGLSVTFAEPKAFEPFAKTIDETVRTTQIEALLKEAGDLADPTWSYRYAPRFRPVSWDDNRHLLGRDVRAYGPLIDDVVTPVLDEMTGASSLALLTLLEEKAHPVEARWRGPLGIPEFQTETEKTFFALTQNELLATVDAASPKALAGADGGPSGETPDQAKERARKDIAALFSLAPDLAALEIAVRKPVDDALNGLDRLIANQPELVLSAAYRDAKEIVGPRDWSVTASYELGSYNLNRALREYRFLQKRVGKPGGTGCPDDTKLELCAFRQVADSPGSIRQIHTTANLTYREVEDYTFKHKYQVSMADKNAELVLPGGNEWRLRLGISRPIALRSAETKQEILDGEQEASDSELGQFKFDVEACRFKDDDSIEKALRRNNRLVARLTWILPAGSGDAMSIPLSITYANKPEFFGEKDGDQFTAHVAISYKLLREKAKEGTMK